MENVIYINNNWNYIEYSRLPSMPILTSCTRENNEQKNSRCDCCCRLNISTFFYRLTSNGPTIYLILQRHLN